MMLYNTMNGGGIHPRLARISAESGYPGNRLPEIRSILRDVNPDIAVLLEMNGWRRWFSAPGTRLGRELGMFSELVSSPSGHHLLLLSRFPIRRSVNFRKFKVFSRAGASFLLDTEHGELHLFAVHLHPNPLDTRRKDEEVRFLAEHMGAVHNAPVLLLGDMNWPPGYDQWRGVLQAHGWSLLGRSIGGRWPVDEAWSRGLLAESAVVLDPVTDLELDVRLLDRTSDHYPLIVRFNV